MRGPPPYRLGAPLRPAARETLALIAARPGLSMTDIAAARGVDLAATFRTIRGLEALGLIRTEVKKPGLPRRCYPVEPA